MSKEWTAGDVFALSGAYWAGCALQTAVELDIFSSLADGPRPEDQLAAEHGCNPRAFGMLVTALVALGFLERGEAGLLAPPSALALLSRNSPEYLGFIVRHHAHIMPAWTRLAEAVRSGLSMAERSASHTPDAGEREDFLMGMFNIARLQAERIAAALDFSGRRRLLDVGGGPGTYALYFCRANPGLSATIFDLPSTEPFARRTIAGFGMEGRVDFAGGDFERDTLPPGQDVAWLSQVLHGESPEQAAALVARAARTLNPGGLLCVQEFTLDDDRKGPEHAALFSLNMLVQTAGGQAYTASEITAMLTAAGAATVRVPEIDLPNSCRVFIAAMPA